MKQYTLVATGGTFDIIHAGHVALLSKSFEISDRVIIGLTSDELAAKRQKDPMYDYSDRLDALTSMIEEKFPGSEYKISRLDADFGPAILEQDVQALVVSDETSPQGDILNRLRSERNMLPVDIVIVPMVLASDGARISTSRIRNKEIDSKGNAI